MARLYPATTRQQAFFTEQYDNESYNRLRKYYPKDRDPNAVPQIRYRGYGESVLPNINPNKYAQRKLQEELEHKAKLIAEVQQTQSKEEMYRPPEETLNKLYDGFSKEGKGRSQYLLERREEIPEKKYSFPILSSQKYGWKLDRSPSTLKKPNHARSRKIMDTFYRRNGLDI